MVRVLFLGPLADLEGAEERVFAAPLDWAGLLAQVSVGVAEQLQDSRVHVACRGSVLSAKTGLDAQQGDEVALLPPVSGG